MKYIPFLLILCSFLHCQEKTGAEKSTLKQTMTQNQPLDEKKYKVVLPENFDPMNEYPILLGLSGGNQSPEIVDYCYQVWFKSHYFDQYIYVMPINHNGVNLNQYSADEIQKVTDEIQAAFHTKLGDWLTVGTSNGGVASFNFLAKTPSLYQGIVVIPGFLGKIQPTDEWKHLKVVFAYGEKDSSSWINSSKEGKTKLENKVKSVDVLALKNVGHILPEGYPIDQVYDLYFRNTK